MESLGKQFRKPVHEQTPGELFITKLGLDRGVRIKLVKITSGGQSDIKPGTVLEGVLDSQVSIGNSIFLDNRSKNTSEIVAVKEENERIFFKTKTSVYELVPPTDKNALKPKSKEVIAIERKLAVKLKEAQDVALSHTETESLFKKRMSYPLVGRSAQMIKEITELDKQLEKHKIMVETLVEYKILMNMLGKNYYRVNDVVMHENAHANKAQAVGAVHEGYSITVSKSKDGKGFSYNPTANLKVPTSWDEKDRIEANIKIGFAPEEYGNSLSDNDERQLARLKNQLKKFK